MDEVVMMVALKVVTWSSKLQLTHCPASNAESMQNWFGIRIFGTFCQLIISVLRQSVYVSQGLGIKMS